ncbi:hypothetical protein [Mycobacterium aquaticum]|uniref:Uncharacterized protein n=1 Tax=Mycobacterium aquaticum TaxID=1927124 RepID=A0A1X0A4Z2_9MYCO|nr:hypothetical protein [Mycobacterium aquaticum]ORA24938.1 hypothetical protein BST13_33765 [Mycobacterium aquaticum]
MTDSVINRMVIRDRRADDDTVSAQVVVSIDPAAFVGVPVAEWPAVVVRELGAASIARVDFHTVTRFIDTRNGGAG